MLRRNLLRAVSVAALASSAFASSVVVQTAFAESGATVITTENIPWANCEVYMTGWVDKRQYKCTVGDGFSSVQALIGGLIKYATFITGLVGVLMIVVSGIQYSLSGGDGDMKTKAKGRIVQLISGLVLLFLMWFILNSVAPWVYK